MQRTLLVLVITWLLVPGSGARAQLAPSVGYAFPAGGKAGTTVEVRLGGADWTPDMQFLVHEPRVKLEVVGPPGPVLMPEPPYWFGIKSFANDPPLPREVVARFVLPANQPPGPVHWRVANASGGSVSAGVFVVGTGTEVIENERSRQPQDLPALPVTVSGRLGRIEEVDRYRFRVARSGPVTCDLMARRLGSDFHGVLAITDESGHPVAEAVDTEGTDPALTFAAQKEQTYTVAVHDLDYRGYCSLTYRLTLTPGPRVLVALPAAGRRGEKRSVEFLGIGVASGQNKLESVTRAVTFPADADRTSFPYRLDTPFGTAPDFALLLSDLPEIVATPLTPAATAPDARRLTPPVAVTGRLTERDGKDSYTFAGKKGEQWHLTGAGRRLGSRLDVTLAVLGPDGKQLAATDPTATTPDARLAVTLPADGVYRIVVGDVSGTSGSPRATYRLVVDRPALDFRLGLAVPNVNVPLGGKASLVVTVDRAGGFKEPIALTLTGLPAGVTVPASLIIPATANSLSVALTCARDAPASAVLVQVTGTAKVGDKMVTKTASTTVKGDLAPHDPDANRLPAVLVATTIKPPFKVKPVEADGGRRVHRGATHLAELLIERTPGFAGEIILDMAGTQSRHRQGIRGPALPVAPTVHKVPYPVFLPECLETARTSRIALVAMARVPDGKGTLRYVLAALEGQITMSIEGALMKLTHAADELTVRAGQPFAVPLKLARAVELTGPATVELVVPEELAGLLTAKPLPWPPGKETANFPIASKNDPRLTGIRLLTARATTLRDGHPVVSEATFEVEFGASGLKGKPR